MYIRSTPLKVQSVHCAPYRVASGVYECMFTNTGMAVESVPIAGTQSGHLSAKVTLWAGTGVQWVGH